MNGVMIPGVSAGSNQVGASETCDAPGQLPLPARRRAPGAGTPATRPSAPSASRSRRVRPKRIAARRRSCRRVLRHGPFTHPPDPWLRASSSVRVRSSRRSRALDRDVLVGRGVGEAGDQAEPGLADPRPDPVEEAQQPDRRVDRPARGRAAASCAGSPRVSCDRARPPAAGTARRYRDSCHRRRCRP